MCISNRSLVVVRVGTAMTPATFMRTSSRSCFARKRCAKLTKSRGRGHLLQAPQPLDTDPGFGQTGLTSNRSVHYDVGVEQEITHAIDVSVDTYYKPFSNLVETGSGNSGDG